MKSTVATNKRAAISLTIDRYDSLGGKSLVVHFAEMDSLLWRSLSLIAQLDQDYLCCKCLIPLIKEITGTSHGRKWFTRRDLVNPLGRLLELVRLWLQNHIKWNHFLHRLRDLGLYRDTLRQWVEGAAYTHKDDEDKRWKHLVTYYNNYLTLRHVATQAYLPLAGKAAASFGLTEDIRPDLFQIGTTGLIHAAERYNNVGPVTFSTYASRWIKQAILMHLSRKQTMIAVSHSVLEEESKINRKERQTGIEDTSPRAQRIKRLSSRKDVLLLDEIEVEEEKEDTPVIDLRNLGRVEKLIIILKHGLLEHATCDYLRDRLETERKRQFEELAKRI